VRGTRGLLSPAAVSVAILLGACHKETQHDGALPIDTAAVMPMLDTSPAPESAAPAESVADSAAIDSATAATAPLQPTEPSFILASDSAAGDRIFHGKGRCFTCHGDRGQGTPRLGPSLSDSAWLAGNGSLASIRDVIAHGVATPKAASVAMPAYSAMLSEQEITLTAAYVYALAHPGSTTPDSAHAGGGRGTGSGTGGDAAGGANGGDSSGHSPTPPRGAPR